MNLSLQNHWPLVITLVVWVAEPASKAADTAPTSIGGNKDLVVVDEDWNVPGDFICQASLPLLLTSPGVQVRALTAVTGDAWCDEGAANALKFLEEIGRTDIPVAKGAIFPLINTSARLAAWEKLHHPLSWRGAWNNPATEPGAHPDTPFVIRPAREGLPRHQMTRENAVALMIRLVHENPHRITFICGGPLTNLALAIRADPQFASLAKRLVLAASVEDTLAGSSTLPPPDFNLVFDPEAAHIVFTADWPDLVIVNRMKHEPSLDAATLARIQEHPTGASNYLAANTGLGLPLWATVPAIVADPSLIKAQKTLRTTLDVETNDRDARYGSVMVAPLDSYAGPSGGRLITIVTEIDLPRYVAAYVAALQSPRMIPAQ